LNGPPDIGEPFDAAAFLNTSVPEERNAFSYLVRADRAFASGPARSSPFNWSDAMIAWSRANSNVRAWAEGNARVVALFQQSAEASDAFGGFPAADVNFIFLFRLLLLEGGRRDESGDTAGDWECYRAVLRVMTHVRRRGSAGQRIGANSANVWLHRRLQSWVADPRKARSQLRVALAELIQSEPRPEWDAFAIKFGYVEIMESVAKPVHPYVEQGLGWECTGIVGGFQLSPGMIECVDSGRRLLLREPERSRRVVQLIGTVRSDHVDA
jgi:hypothetical protein